MKQLYSTADISLLTANLQTETLSYNSYLKLISMLFCAEFQAQSQNKTSKKGSSIHIKQKSFDLFFTPEDVLSMRQFIKNCNWLIIAESNTKDAAIQFPLIQSLVQFLGASNVRMVIAEEHLDLISVFISDNAQAIPKLMAIDKNTGELKGIWGPCMETLNQLYQTYKMQNLRYTA